MMVFPRLYSFNHSFWRLLNISAEKSGTLFKHILKAICFENISHVVLSCVEGVLCQTCSRSAVGHCIDRSQKHQLTLSSVHRLICMILFMSVIGSIPIVIWHPKTMQDRVLYVSVFLCKFKRNFKTLESSLHTW